MKELTKFEMAAVKRTALNVKGLRTKKAKLEDKQKVITDEINQLEEQINMWEQPIIKLTEGFTSEQVLAGEMVEEVQMDDLCSPTMIEEVPNTVKTSILLTPDMGTANSNLY